MKTFDFITINSSGINMINLFGAPKQFTTNKKQEISVPAIEGA